jgi:hypothetical protein
MKLCGLSTACHRIGPGSNTAQSNMGYVGTECCGLDPHRVLVILVVDAYQHSSLEGLLYSNLPMEFRHSSPEALHTPSGVRDLCERRTELSAKEI